MRECTVMNKMNLRLKANEFGIATLVAVATTLIVSTARAATDTSDIVEDYRQPPTNDIVEKFIAVDVFAPYKLRRNTSGFMLGLGVENAQFYNYDSIQDFKTTYFDMFGDSEIPIYNMQLSYKYNFSLGSLMANGGLGYGTYTSGVSGTIRSLNVTKYSLSASYVMDAIFDEPYAAPYVTFGVNQFNIEEKNGAETFSTGIEAAYFSTVGILLQLNWLDKRVSRDALRDFGLQNTYLDLFVTQFQPGLDPQDPNTETEYTFGAGLKLEF
jgi:hypothetical protein